MFSDLASNSREQEYSDSLAVRLLGNFISFSLGLPAVPPGANILVICQVKLFLEEKTQGKTSYRFYNYMYTVKIPSNYRHSC